MRVDISAALAHRPPSCACCMAPDAEREVEVSFTKVRGTRVVRGTSHSWSFPVCVACDAHVTAAGKATERLMMVLFPGLILALLLGFVLAASTAINIALGSGVIGVALFVITRASAAQLRSPECTSTEAPVRMLGWHGSMTSFDFAHEAYATEFMSQNAAKLVNVSADVREVLRAKEAEALAAAEASLAEERLHAEQDLFAATVTKVEAAKGPAGRRAALETGLRKLASDDLRQRLALGAARIGVRAALDKADSLKSAAAKLRTLREALEELRSSSITDDLQGPEAVKLEQAIAEIERASGT